MYILCTSEHWNELQQGYGRLLWPGCCCKHPAKRWCRAG